MVSLNWVHIASLALCLEGALGGSYYDRKFYVDRYNQIGDVAEHEEKAESQSSNTTMYTLKAGGIEHTCQIPLIADDNLIGQDPALNVTELRNQKQEAVQIIKAFNYLNRENFVEKVTTYWTYIVRFDHDIHQLHSDPIEEGRARLSNFKLAAWSDNDDTVILDSMPYYKESHPSDPYEHMSDFELIKSEDGNRYVSQRIGNGEICDLTGMPRTTTINYRCNVNRYTPTIVSVNEWRTCEYVLDLESSFFCGNEIWSAPCALTNNEIECFVKDQETATGKYISLQKRKISSLSSGLMLAKEEDNESKFSLLLTKRYDLWESNQNQDGEFQRLLTDISLGFQKYIRNLRMFPVTISTPFQMIFDVYDTDRLLIGNVMLEQNTNGFLVSYFTDDPVPEKSNFLMNEDVAQPEEGAEQPTKESREV